MSYLSVKMKKLVTEISGYKCAICNISTWNEQHIVLELDHIDGNNQNNNIKNLRLLCPNCHSQTLTFRGRNINGTMKISDQILLEALQSTTNIRQALIKVGLTPKGKNYIRASKLLNQYFCDAVDINNSQYGTAWINNGIHNKKIKIGQLSEYINNGWIRGRLLQRKPPVVNQGKYWVTNGITSIMVFETPVGFWKGRFVKA